MPLDTSAGPRRREDGDAAACNFDQPGDEVVVGGVGHHPRDAEVDLLLKSRERVGDEVEGAVEDDARSVMPTEPEIRIGSGCNCRVPCFYVLSLRRCWPASALAWCHSNGPSAGNVIFAIPARRRTWYFRD